ncbi:MAG: NAD(P)/FAD-dependent oxidoreductase, partial [Pseudomonadota bacterium]
MKSHYPLVVIGAGPAGMACAISAAQHGVEVAVLDAQASPGGQIYRDVAKASNKKQRLLGGDYAAGAKLVKKFERSNAHYFTNASVWYLDNERNIGVTQDGKSHRLTADAVVIATGARERPMPIPGWELPGVMTAGAGQVLLKSAGVIPNSPIVLAGSGPLLLLVAQQYLRAGVTINAILDTTPKANWPKAKSLLPHALLATEYFLKGAQMWAAIKVARVPIYKEVTNIQASGDSSLKQVSFDSSGNSNSIDTNLVLLHQGVIPTVHMAQAAGCKTQWDDGQQCWQVETDSWGQTSRDGIFSVGDGASSGGAKVAQISGELTGLQCAHTLGEIGRNARNKYAKMLWRYRKRHDSI